MAEFINDNVSFSLNNKQPEEQGLLENFQKSSDDQLKQLQEQGQQFQEQTQTGLMDFARFGNQFFGGDGDSTGTIVHKSKGEQGQVQDEQVKDQ